MRDHFHKQLKQASFNGVPFQIESDDLSAGKRVEVHEYPYRDDRLVEEYGLSAKKYQIQCFVCGDDCIVQRDALLSALEEAGEGILIHPYYGEKRGTVGEITVSHRWAEGRKVSFTFTFYPGENKTIRIHSIARIPNAVRDVQAAAVNRFSIFNVTKLPAFVGEKALQDFNQALNVVSRAYGVIGRGSAGALDVFRAELPTLFGNSGYLAQRWISAISGMAGFVRSQTNRDKPTRQAQRIVAMSKSYQPSSLTGESTINAQIKLNSTAITRLVKTSMVAEAANGLDRVELSKTATYDDLQATLTALQGAINELLQDAEDNEYDALTKLQSAVTTDILPIMRDVARLLEVNMLESLPILVIAYERYSDLNRMDELLDMNKISNPMFSKPSMKMLTR